MILAQIDDSELLTRLGTLSPDGLLRFTLLGGTVRGAVVSGTCMVNAMRANHRLGILETLALGQVYLAGALVSTTLKEGMRASIGMAGSGVLGGYSADVAWNGDVRGYLHNGAIKLDRPLESFDLAPFFGTGTLSVVRRSDDGKGVFTGQVEAKTGRVAEDLSHYFLTSEQIKTAISVSVRFDKAGRVAGAGGLYLQAMPGAAEIDVEDTEHRLTELPSLGDWFAQGRSSRELLAEWFSAFGPENLVETPVSFACSCTRERFAAFLRGLGSAELDAMAEEGPLPIELTCRNCNSVYLFQKEEILALSSEVATKSEP